MVDSSDQGGALSDLVAIEYSEGISGAMCAKALADLGADVIKIEPPEGNALRHSGPFPNGEPDPEASGQFLYLNANKRGVTIDLHSENGRQQLDSLLETADFFVTDISSADAKALEISHEYLETTHPLLICASVTPFGNSGPYKDYQGTDLIVWHMGGMGWETPGFAVTDPPNEPPLRGRGNMAMLLAGWTAALASMIALFYREKYGVGQDVDISALESVANHIRGNFSMHSYDPGSVPETREKAFFSWVWPCKDGHVSAAFTLDHWWASLVEVMGSPQWATNTEYAGFAGRRESAAVIEVLVHEWMKDQTRGELYEKLQSAGVPCFPVQSTSEVMDSPHYKAREFFVNQEHPKAGSVTQPGPPIRLSETPWKLRRPAPILGQHNNDIPNGVRIPEKVSAVSQLIHPTVTMNRPLEGIRIVDFGWILSVPHCGAWLGSLGAEVIRVESNARLELGRRGVIGGADGISGVNRGSNWNGLNYSKLGATLDLRNPEAKTLVEELVATSDVVMENFATDVLERLGLGYSHLRTIKPDLVMISGSTMGVTGPDRNSTGWGPNVCSYAGQPFLTGYEGGSPQNLGGNWPDYLVGTIMAFSILSTLWHRNKTGQGQYIEVAMAETISSMIPEAFLEYSMTGQQVERIGNHDPDMAPHNVYPCLGDDAWVALAVRSDEEWRSLCQVMGHPELSHDAKFAAPESRKTNEKELDRLVGEWCATRTNSAITASLQAKKIPAGSVMNVVDLLADPHMIARGYVVEMDHPEVGKRSVAGLPISFSAMPQLPYFSAPLLGQHNDFVFGDLLGHNPERVQKLKHSQAIY